MRGEGTHLTTFIKKITNAWVAVAQDNGPQDVTFTVMDEVDPITATENAWQGDRFMEPLGGTP